MLLDIPCKQGRIKIDESGNLLVVAPFNRVLWQAPASTLSLSQQTKTLSVSVTFSSRLGNFTCDTITKQNFARLQQVFATILSTQPAPQPISAPVFQSTDSSPSQPTFPPVPQPVYVPLATKPKPRRRNVVAGVVVIAVVTIFVSVIANATQSPANSTTTVTTDTPTPTTVSETPTPTFTVAQNVQATAQGNATLDDKVTTQYDNSAHTIAVTVTLSEAFDNNGYRVAVRSNCFDIQKAEWHNIHGLSQVTVNFLGPTVDAYGNKGTGGLGQCVLTSDTESKFNWDNLDADQAWNVYDQAGYAGAIQG